MIFIKMKQAFSINKEKLKKEKKTIEYRIKIIVRKKILELDKKLLD